MDMRHEGSGIEADLNWDDWGILTKGGEIGTRYDGENKLLIRMSENGKSYAEFDRRIMDIFVYVSERVLRDVRCPYSVFNLELGNLNIFPTLDSCEDMDLRIYYPGSLKVLDVPCFCESMELAKLK